MDRNALINLSVELGRRMMESGAEIHRVEDSLRRLMSAYGEEDAQVFAIPNCFWICLAPQEAAPVTRLCRIPSHGIDLDTLELCNAVCRRLCREKPSPEDALRQVAAIDAERPRYSAPLILLGHFMVGAFFTPFFGGGAMDALCGGLCGLAVGLAMQLFRRMPANGFFHTLLSSALATFLALALARFGIARNPHSVTIGALMLLVPGTALVTAMREIVAEDVVSGVTRFAEVILTAAAIALGAGLGMVFGRML